MRRRALCACIVLSAGGSAAAPAASSGPPPPVELSLQVEPQQQQCFYADLRPGWIADASVLVYRGGQLDVKLRLESPDGTPQYEQLLFSNQDASGALLDTIVKKVRAARAWSDTTWPPLQLLMLMLMLMLMLTRQRSRAHPLSTRSLCRARA
jgi:hypothetical protein